MTKKNQDDKASFEAVYIGRRGLAKGTGFAVITPTNLEQVLDEDDPAVTAFRLADRVEQAASYFSGRFSGIVGGVYTFEGALGEDGRINRLSIPKYPQFIRSYKTDLLGDWRIKDDHIEQEKRSLKHQKDAEKRDYLMTSVGVLHRHYKNVSPGYRRSFQLWLLDKLDKGV